MKKSALASAIIIIVLFITGLFLFSQNQNLKQEIDVLNQKIEELQKVKPEPAAEKILEGWKEYVDKEYKFRIWYPEEFALEYPEINATGIKDQTKIQKKENAINFYVNVLSDAPLRLLYIYIYDSNFDIKDYAENNAKEIIKNFPVLMLQKETSDPQNYITNEKFNGLDLYKLEIPSEYILRYYVKKNDKIYVLKPESENFPELKSTVDQMVHSFKFIE